MKARMIFLAMALMVLCVPASVAEGETADTLEAQNTLSTTLYTGGAEEFSIGGYQLRLPAGAKVQEIALIGAGERAKLSWSAYALDGMLMVDIQVDTLITPGTEDYTLSMQISDKLYSQQFTILVVHGVPLQKDGILFDIPASVVVGETITIPAPRYADGAPLPEDMKYTFILQGDCIANTGENHYTAVEEGKAHWSLSLTSGNYTSASMLGSIEVAAFAQQAISIVHMVDVSKLSTKITVGSLNGYKSIGTVIVTADIAENDVLTAELEGANTLVDLFLSEPVIENGKYLYSILASDARSEGTAEYTFTAQANDSAVSASFEIIVEALPAPEVPPIEDASDPE